MTEKPAPKTFDEFLDSLPPSDWDAPIFSDGRSFRDFWTEREAHDCQPPLPPSTPEIEAVLRLLTPEFFEELEWAGCICLSEQHRNHIGGLLWRFMHASVPKPSAKQENRECKTTANLARALVSILAGESNYAARLLKSQISQESYESTLFDLRYLAGIAVGRVIETRKNGARKKPTSILVAQLAWTYEKAGGTVTTCRSDPFANFLKKMWTVLPSWSRPSTPEAFAKIAKKPFGMRYYDEI